MNLLFVSVAFPPKNDPECIQAARYFKYLSCENDLNIDVVTSSTPTLFMPIDGSLTRYDTGYRQKIEIPIFESKLTNYALRIVGLGNMLFPDSKMTFHWQWRRVISSLNVKPDAIYSRSNPISSAIMALKLKRHFGVPWVMHMSDPWSISPLHEMSASFRKKALSVEKQLFEQADRITFTTSKTLEVYSSLYRQQADKFTVLPNVFDADEDGFTGMQEERKLRIVYAGGLTGNRNVKFLDSVLKILSIKMPEVSSYLEFIFVGDMDRMNRAYFEQAHTCLTHQGLLSQTDAKKLCESAHVLLVVDNPTRKADAMFFPSKLLDYFLAKRMIWAVTPAGSTTREVLEGSNHISFQHWEIAEMAEFLMEAIRRWLQKDYAYFQSDWIPEKFNALTNAKKLYQLIKQSIQ